MDDDYRLCVIGLDDVSPVNDETARPAVYRRVDRREAQLELHVVDRSPVSAHDLLGRVDSSSVGLHSLQKCIRCRLDLIVNVARSAFGLHSLKKCIRCRLDLIVDVARDESALEQTSVSI